MPRRAHLICSLCAVVAAATAVAPATSGDRARVLVKFEPGTPQAAIRHALQAAGAESQSRVRGIGVRVVSVPARDRAAAVAALRRSAMVEFAEADETAFTILGETSRSLIPTDPLWAHEWGLRAIGAPRAWATTRGNRAVVVATLDSGVDPNHPDLRGALVPGRDVVNGDDAPDDDNGHGTAVAGLIAARADNALGISGVCPRCSLMPVKVTTAAGTASDSNVAAGLTWAVDHGARVVNLSLGGASYSETIHAAIRYAVGKGAVVVSSAGNSSSGSEFYPAADQDVLGVAATDGRDRLYTWSNYGPWVDVAAPGCGLSTARGGQYANFCGTSASAPLVAGVVALALAAGADAARATKAVSTTTRPVSGVASGRVDAAAALRALGTPHYRAVRMALAERAVELGRGPS